jgi:hypothetical protein
MQSCRIIMPRRYGSRRRTSQVFELLSNVDSTVSRSRMTMQQLWCLNSGRSVVVVTIQISYSVSRKTYVIQVQLQTIWASTVTTRSQYKDFGITHEAYFSISQTSSRTVLFSFIFKILLLKCVHRLGPC